MERTRASSQSKNLRIRPDIVTDEFLGILRAHGVVKASLFGSVSRGEERPESYVDLLVTFDRDASFGERFLLEEALRRTCGRQMDVLTDIHPAFAPYIIPTLVPLPV